MILTIYFLCLLLFWVLSGVIGLYRIVNAHSSAAVLTYADVAALISGALALGPGVLVLSLTMKGAS